MATKGKSDIGKKTPQMLSHYRGQKTKSRDGGGKQLKKRTAYAKVHCDAHGVQSPDGRLYREVTVPIPRTRKEKYNIGCPVCAQLKRAALKK